MISICNFLVNQQKNVRECKKNKQINAINTQGFSAWKWENWIDTKAGELVEHDVHWVYIHLCVCTNCFVVFTTMKLQFVCVYAMEWYDMMWCDVRGKLWWWWRKRQRDRKKSVFTIQYFLLPPQRMLVSTYMTCFCILHFHSHSLFSSSSLSLDTINRVFFWVKYAYFDGSYI